MAMTGQKIIVAMSGGIDSSVSAWLLLNQGWKVQGLSFKFADWNEKAIKTAARVCQILNIPHQIIEPEADFKKYVIDYFIAEHKKGRTPNPCVVCNKEFKFKYLIEQAKLKNINFIATGHYARTKKLNLSSNLDSEPQLLQAKDKLKDQSYYLSFLKPGWLRKIVFPLGSLKKDQVYELAGKADFNFLLKQKSSQDICFLADQKLTGFLKKSLGQKPGKIITKKGRVLGKHQGLHFYTIGQRKGIKLGQGPFWVLKKDYQQNQLTVTKVKKDLYQKKLLMRPFNFLSIKPPKEIITVRAKVRYRQPLAAARLMPVKDNILQLEFLKAQKAITPGQFCVFYKGEICLGGGRILVKA
jgi:tRNA-uridine 2-sulfurtransferase